jgi:hypothetical protein
MKCEMRGRKKREDNCGGEGDTVVGKEGKNRRIRNKDTKKKRMLAEQE